jgi:DNA-binding helix-hairpin-helix protein with protein kinase domain/Flp pilus assembly protein TadD
MVAKAKPQLYDGQGRPVSLGIELGRGGEGSVHEVRDRADLVAKVYLKNVNQDKAAKLATMVSLKTERLLKLTAWPVDTLYERPGGIVLGFLMPKVTDHKDIHVLYGVKSRLAEYPEACWPFLIQAAGNVARAFNVIHEHGHVIGDVNHGGIVVSKKATVRLVDCDSFQVNAQGQLFLCEVGVATHTPPELQGLSFRGTTRTTNHDAFGLAVIIFQLLFMGRHPFSGAYLGSGDMPIEKAIKEHRFAYGPGAPSRQMRQPPATLPLDAVSQPVAKLFEQAFLPGMARPKPQEWITALSELATNLKQCNHNNGHYYLKSLSSCSWCEVEARSGITVFGPIFVTGTWSRQGTFNIIGIWAQITAIPSPGHLPALPDKSSLNIAASPKAIEMNRKRRLRVFFATGLLVVVSAVLLVIPISGGATALLIIIFGLIAMGVSSGETGSARSEFANAKRDAEKRWQEVEHRWRMQGDEGRFFAKLRELESRKSEHQKLPEIRAQKLQQLEIDIRERQRHRFLDRYRIDSATISGIGHARKITLRSYGIETADDVNERAILAVPGFGPTYAEKLMAWRRSIEQRFVFDPARGIDPADREALEREIAATHMKIEQELQSGPTQLRQISHQITAMREAMRPIINDSIRALAQAEADLGNRTSSSVMIAPLIAVMGLSLLSTALLKVDFTSQSRSSNYNSRQSNISTKVVPSPGFSSQQPQNSNASSPLAPDQQAKALYDEGIKLTKAGKYEDAVKAYQQAITLKPDLAEAHHELGYALFKLGKYEDAIAAFKQASTLKPKNAETYRNLGLSYKALGRWDESILAFQKAIELKPDQSTTYYNLGLVYKERMNNNSAIEAYKEAVRLKPEFAAAHYELGLSYLAAGDKTAAMEEYTALTSLNQKLADQLYTAINK